MKTSEPFSGVVLAGGASTRMGVDKAFLRVGGAPLLERQLGCLRAAGAAELLISGRRGVDYSRFGAAVVYDDVAASGQEPGGEGPGGVGPLAGVAAAFRVAAFAHLLVLAVDMPGMTSAMLGRIVSGRLGGAGCVPVDGLGDVVSSRPAAKGAAGRGSLGGGLGDRGFQPLAAVYPKELLPLAEGQLRAGKYSMRALVELGIAAGLVRTLEIRPEERVCFSNWNRPGDWASEQVGSRSHRG